MTIYDPEDQADRRRVLRNDERVRNQSRDGDTGTYLSHTHSEVGGRFALTEHQTVTGVVSPAPPPLPSNSPWAGADPVPDEPPLGYRIDDLNQHSDPESSTGVTSSPVATDDPAHAPSGGSGPATSSGGLMSELAGSSSFSETATKQGD
jgi:hypothetical protein